MCFIIHILPKPHENDSKGILTPQTAVGEVISGEAQKRQRVSEWKWRWSWKQECGQRRSTGKQALSDKGLYTLMYTHTHTLPILFCNFVSHLALWLSLYTHTHTHTHTHTLFSNFLSHLALWLSPGLALRSTVSLTPGSVTWLPSLLEVCRMVSPPTSRCREGGNNSES